MPDFPALSDFTSQELVLMADTHDDLAFAAMLGGSPDMRQGDGLYEMLTGIMNPFGNMMFGMLVPDAENRVRAVTERLRESGAPAFWWVGPLTKPEELGDILERYGWGGPDQAPAMVVDIAKLPEDVGPEGLELREVTTPQDLSVWCSTAAVGFDMPLEAAQLCKPKADGSFALYTAFQDDIPVATTALFYWQGVAGIYCVSTVPGYRGQGIGAAVTARPLQLAATKGYKTGTLQASKMGHPVYKRLGFRDVCHLSVYTFGM